MSTINRDLARLAFDLEEAFEKVFDDHFSRGDNDLGKIYAPIGLYLTTIDGVTASFMEEGVEFYPNLKIEKKD